MHLSVPATGQGHGEVVKAAEHATAFAGGDPLVFGGDLNLRPRQHQAAFDELRERFGLAAPTAPRAIDHLLCAGLDTVEAAARAARLRARVGGAERPADQAFRPRARRSTVQHEIVHATAHPRTVLPGHPDQKEQENSWRSNGAAESRRSGGAKKTAAKSKSTATKRASARQGIHVPCGARRDRPRPSRAQPDRASAQAVRRRSQGGGHAQVGVAPSARRQPRRVRQSARTARRLQRCEQDSQARAPMPLACPPRPWPSCARRISKRLIDPLGLVMLTRSRIEDTLQEAVSSWAGDRRRRPGPHLDPARARAQADQRRDGRSGGVARTPAERRSRSAPSAATEAARRARTQVEDATARARREAVKQGDPLLAQADRARRAAGVGPSFPITGYDDLTFSPSRPASDSC